MPDKILIINNYDKGNYLRNILSKGIPWNEEVVIFDGDSAIKKITILGETVNKVFSIFNIPFKELNDHIWLENKDNIISVDRRYGDTIIEILTPSINLFEIKEKLLHNGFEDIDDDSWNKYRIQVGILGNKEINDKIPFNVGMGQLVKMDKGCYPGQEIHARLESRGKQNKALVTLESKKYIDEGEYKINNGGKIIITTAISDRGSSSKYFGIIPIEYTKKSKIVLLNLIELEINKIIDLTLLRSHH